MSKDYIKGALFALFIVTLSCCGCSFLNKTLKMEKDDGPLEELIEDIIEDQSGLKIDLTPDSEEDA